MTKTPLKSNFRLFQSNRVKYNKNNYKQVFEECDEQLSTLQRSVEEPSLSECIQSWLERTPGLKEEGFNFIAKFKEAVNQLLAADEEAISVRLGVDFFLSMII